LIEKPFGGRNLHVKSDPARDTRMMKSDRFLDLLRRSQLVEEHQLTEFLGALASSNGDRIPNDADRLAGFMVDAGLLTEWQSEKLLGGKYKGFILGDYKLLRRLDKDGMSQVYLAENTLVKRKMAIKVLPAGS